ncbi:MAG: GFA family protein [Gammaproteobacteria bacterium]|nr:GFA family protein [Gammaproteobacteria bacterium]
MSDLNLKGSCLCGAVSYEISGEPGQFWHCHCSRCRKATGTGHATNILMKPESVNWSQGNDLLTYYKVPDAKRFATVFCRVCGSLMPRVAPDMSIAVIPAGTLDNDPGMRPQGRIFQDSKAPWSCDSGDLACHDTYPGRG